MSMSSPDLGMPMPPPRIVQSPPPPGYLNQASQSQKEELQFPAGLRVLVVDDDQATLKVLGTMLRCCLYTVTTCGMATKALELLRENKNNFDLVISDVHMPDMNGFKLLELVGLEMDLPVIMMSVDGDRSTVMEGVTHGACDYLMKPVRMEELKNIWQHVVRKKQHGVKEHEPQEPDKLKRRVEEADYGTSSAMSKKRKDVKEEEEDLEQEGEDPSSLKKQRVVWSPDLHRQFVDAVNQLGVDKAFPKKILELMDVPGLTRENVASHLQKYRLYLRKSAAMMCGTSSSAGDVRPMAATSYSTVTGVEPAAVLGTASSSAVDSPALLPFPGIQGAPVIRPGITSPVFSTQPSNYFSNFTTAVNQLEPVLGYGQMQPQPRPDTVAALPSVLGYGQMQSQPRPDTVAALPLVHHQAAKHRLGYGNSSSGAFHVAPASNPLMVQLLQPRQHQQQEQGLNLSMTSLTQQHQRLVPGGVSLGINNNTEAGYCMGASKSAGGPLLVEANPAAAGILAAAAPLATAPTAPITTSAFNSVVDFGTKLPVTNGYSSMLYDNNRNRIMGGGGWQDLAQVMLSPRYSESVASRNFNNNNNNNFVAESQVNLDMDGRRESESTADSSFKPKMGTETMTRFGLENQAMNAAVAAAAPDDLVSYYLKQQQEDLSYQDNGMGFDGFVLDNVCA